jgi:hypothetical protein
MAVGGLAGGSGSGSAGDMFEQAPSVSDRTKKDAEVKRMPFVLQKFREEVNRARPNAWLMC